MKFTSEHLRDYQWLKSSKKESKKILLKVSERKSLLEISKKSAKKKPRISEKASDENLDLLKEINLISKQVKFCVLTSGV